MCTMKRITITLVSIVTLATSAFATTATMTLDDNRPITVDELPHQAKAFITKNFANDQMTLITQDKEVIGNEYKVRLSSGTEIEFDSKGEWTEVETIQGEVPSHLVPNKIADYVAKNYPNSHIKELKREARGWEVRLSTGVELEFNSHLRIVEIDD